MRTALLAILFVGGAIIACAIELAVFRDRDPRPATVTDREIAATELEIHTIEALETQLDALVGCTAKAAALELHAAELNAVADELDAMVHAPPKHDMAADAWMHRHYRDRERVITARMKAIYRGCSDDAGFVESFEPLRRLWTDID